MLDVLTNEPRCPYAPEDLTTIWSDVEGMLV